MKNTKLNMSGAMDSVPENAGKVNDFEQIKRTFETAFAGSGDYAGALIDLATAVTYSVVRKCIDPQRKTAVGRETVSDNGLNPALLALRRGIAADIKLLCSTQSAANAATRSTFNVDGYPVTVTADKDAATALNAIIGDTLSDGIDLVQTAACAILEQAADHADGPGWLDRPYFVNRLSRRVYIRADDSAAYRDEETAPMREIFRAVRRAVQESRAVQTDPRSGYTYIEDLTADGLDVIYYRLHKYADLGGYNVDGNYTADRQTIDDYNAILGRLELTDRQAVILRLRMQGKGYKAIASYLGVSDKAVKKTVLQIKVKAIDIGLTPSADN